MHSESIDTRSGAIRYWRGGKGTPVVLLQGGMGDAALHWSRLWDSLAERHEVFAPDLPGFGGSAPLPRTTFPALATWLAGFHEALRLNASILVGAELGAALARTYSATHPRGCRRIVLINGGGLPSWFERIGARLTPVEPPRPKAERLFSRDRLAQMVVDPALLTDDVVAACQTSSAIVPMMRQLARGPAPMRRPFAPTLVLWGERDRITPPEVGEQVAADMPGAAFRLLRGCGHLPHIEAPAVTADALFAFIG
jgi:pimeloyl-ACP methyl ester carboxylesterase